MTNQRQPKIIFKDFIYRFLFLSALCLIAYGIAIAEASGYVEDFLDPEDTLPGPLIVLLLALVTGFMFLKERKLCIVKIPVLIFTATLAEFIDPSSVSQALFKLLFVLLAQLYLFKHPYANWIGKILFCAVTIYIEAQVIFAFKALHLSPDIWTFRSKSRALQISADRLICQNQVNTAFVDEF